MMIKSIPFLLFSFLIVTAQQGNAQYVSAKQDVSAPLKAKVVSVDEQATRNLFKELSHNANTSSAFTIFNPDGEELKLSIELANTMHPQLAAKYPDIVAVKGTLENQAGFARLEMTHSGFHGYVSSAKGVFMIEKLELEGKEEYLCYWKSDYAKMKSVEPKPFSCGVTASANQSEVKPFGYSKMQRSSTAPELRTYRLAVAGSGQYTQFFGGVPQALSAVVTTMNRVNGIYERDFSITMQLIANNDQLLFTDGNTDPYDDFDNGVVLSQNQNAVDAVVGNGSYDIGHVFTRIGGGIASLGSVCRNSSKARGVTGRGTPQGDPFDVDYVAHEMGHQFGANHTQNNNCNRNPSTAVEPGSASTIMGYAGICSPNIQNNSDDYFHAISYDEIMDFTINDLGFNCAQKTNTGNTAPVVNAKTTNVAIPIETPFFLAGDATDADGDLLTYCWEQMDVQFTSTPLSNPSGNAPIFRSFSPSVEGTRYLPTKLGVIVGNPVIGETYPTYGRTMNFRLSVRDNNPNGGAQTFIEELITVNDNMGPFTVTGPAQGERVEQGSALRVEWDVANTWGSFCPNVHILWSPDQGETWTDTLLAETPNDGVQDVVLPDTMIFAPKIIVIGASQPFYNMSELFRIVNATPQQNGALNLIATRTGSTEALVTWDDMAVNESYYVVERSYGGNQNFAPIDTLVGNATSYTDLNVDFSQVVYYRVYSFNTVAVSPYSNEDFINSVGLNEIGSELVQLSPNPFSEFLSISSKTNLPYEVYNANGQLVHEGILGNGDRINTESWNSGMYFLTFSTSQKTHQLKLIKY